MKENEDYSFVLPSEPNANTVHFKFLKGEFKDVVFLISGIGVDEKEEPEEAYLNFNFEVIDKNGIDNLEENEEFKNMMGNVLLSIIENKLDEWSSSLENRTDNTEASDL